VFFCVFGSLFIAIVFQKTEGCRIKWKGMVPYIPPSSLLEKGSIVVKIYRILS
jgi:hypothetical protein